MDFDSDSPFDLPVNPDVAVKAAPTTASAMKPRRRSAWRDKPGGQPNSHPLMKITTADNVGDRFYKAAIMMKPPGRSDIAMELAVHLHTNMDWKTGRIPNWNSSREIARILGHSRQGIINAYRYWEKLGVIAPATATGNKEDRWASAGCVNLKTGQLASECWQVVQPAMPVTKTKVVQPAVPVGGPPHCTTITSPSVTSPEKKKERKMTGPVSLSSQPPPSLNSEPTLPASTLPIPPANTVDATKAATNADATASKGRAGNRGRAPVVGATKKSAKAASATKKADRVPLTEAGAWVLDGLVELSGANEFALRARAEMVAAKYGQDVAHATILDVTAALKKKRLQLAPGVALTVFAKGILPEEAVETVAKWFAEQKRAAQREADRVRRNLEDQLNRAEREAQRWGDYALEQDARRDGSFYGNPNWLADARAKDVARAAAAQIEVQRLKKELASLEQ